MNLIEIHPFLQLEIKIFLFVLELRKPMIIHEFDDFFDFSEVHRMIFFGVGDASMSEMSEWATLSAKRMFVLSDFPFRHDFVIFAPPARIHSLWNTNLPINHRYQCSN